MNNKKLIKEATLLQRGRSASHFVDNRWRWGEVLAALKDAKIELQDTDILEVGLSEGYDHGDSARDDSYDLTIIRIREETDDEYEKRMQKNIDAETRNKELRYKTYLKLQKEFG